MHAFDILGDPVRQRGYGRTSIVITDLASRRGRGVVRLPWVGNRRENRGAGLPLMDRRSKMCE